MSAAAVAPVIRHYSRCNRLPCGRAVVASRFDWHDRAAVEGVDPLVSKRLRLPGIAVPG